MKEENEAMMISAKSEKESTWRKTAFMISLWNDFGC